MGPLEACLYVHQAPKSRGTQPPCSCFLGSGWGLTWLFPFFAVLPGLLVYFSYGIWHSKENLRDSPTQDVRARYVVFPSSSLEETVQPVQPRTEPAQGLTEAQDSGEEAKR